MSAMSNAITFLVSIVFDFFIVMLIARLLLEQRGVRANHPMVQTLMKLTKPVVQPLQAFIPVFKGFDLSIVLLIVVFSWLETMLLSVLSYGSMPGLLGSLFASIGVAGLKVVNFYFYVVLIQILMSWVVSLQQGPIAELVYLISAPLLNRARAVVPTLGGMDFSPAVVLIALKLIGLLVFTPLISFSA